MTESANTALLHEVVQVLKAEGVEPILIGAAALAFHGYPRFTEDVDFAVASTLAAWKKSPPSYPGKPPFPHRMRRTPAEA